jgi:streptomycin 6-kinase
MNALSVEFRHKIENTWPQKGPEWLQQLPQILSILAEKWRLQYIQPFNNLSYHFVANAFQKGRPVVVKVGCDPVVSLNEYQALHHFDGYGSIRALGHAPELSALLLESALPGIPLKTLIMDKSTLNHYATVVKALSQVPCPQLDSFPHVRTWLESIDKINDPRIPTEWIVNAKELKAHLLKNPESEYLCHGDLHFDNVLSHEDRFVSIDPKGMVGEMAFEASAFDLFSPEELENSELNSEIAWERIQCLSQLLQLKPERLLAWIFLRVMLSIQWFVEDRGDPAQMLKMGEKIFPILKN